MLSVLSRAAWPLARVWARDGYFHIPDLDAIEAANIALVACHWVGDTFWAAQVVEPLRRRFPRALISAITKPHSADLWHGLVEPQQVILAPQLVSDRRREQANWRSMADIARDLRSRQFDLVIDLMGNRYSAAFTFLLRPRHSIGFDGQELGWLYSLRVQAELPGEHLSQRPLRLIQPLIRGTGVPPMSVADVPGTGVADVPSARSPLAAGAAQREETHGRDAHATGSATPAPPLPTIDPSKLLAELGLSGKRYQVIAPFAGWHAKDWPEDKFASLALALRDRGFAIVIVGTAAQKARCTELANSVASLASGQIPGAQTLLPTIVFAGRPLGELVALLSQASGAAANDSAVAHIAAAFAIPTAAIFTANTDPQHVAPLGPKAKVFNQDCPIDQLANYLAGE